MMKILSVLLLLALSLTLCACNIQIYFERGGEAEFEFELNEDGKSYSVTGITNRLPDTANFPASYNGLPVTEIHETFLVSVKNITIPDSITYIDEFSLFGCELLESITVDPNNTCFKSVDGNLYSKDGKTLILYAAGKKDTSFAIPEGVEVIGDYAFFSAGYLKDLTIPESVERLGSLSKLGLYSYNPPDFIKVENGVYYVDRWVIGAESDVTTAILRENTFGIAEFAFYDCKNLAEIKIPDTVTVIEHAAFNTTCPAIENENGIYYADTWVVGYDKELRDAVVRENTVGITDGAFNGSSFTRISLPSSLKYLGEDFFSAMILLSVITVGENNSHYKITDSCLYTIDGKTLLRYIPDDFRINYTIPDGVEVISNYAFPYYLLPDSITIPNSVRKICADFNYSGDIYYEGTIEEWHTIMEEKSFGYDNFDLYLYSETQPTEDGNFWHYDKNGKVTEW